VSDILKRKGVWLSFLVPFVGLTAFFAVSSFLNQRALGRRTETLVRGQLEATADILQAAAGHLLEEGFAAADIIRIISERQSVYFLALLDRDRNVLAWDSSYEGYLPLSAENTFAGRPAVIDSPVGRVFSVFREIATADGNRRYLFLGYGLAPMDGMLAAARRTALLTLLLLVLAGAAFLRGVSLLQARYIDKSVELEMERREKEHFREVSALTSGVAHEVKNPLNSLALLFELLLQKAPGDMKEDVRLGRAEIDKMARTVDLFSTAARPFRGERRRLAVADILAAARDAVEREAPGSGGRVSIRSEGGLAVYGDADSLTRALINLIRNALEASEEGPVEVEARASRRSVEIAVSDHGPGIPEEDLARVFEPFFSTKTSGLGIGLYLVKRTVEAHGGAVSAAPGPDRKGARFLVRLPEA
jgi:signal transduction histidine kinase